MVHNKTLKNKIHKYILKKKDICCEKYLDKNMIIELIIKKYKIICEKMNEPNEYMNWINNDILLFIGSNNITEMKKDKEGIKLIDIMNKMMMQDNGGVVQLLKDVPLYYLLSFLGYASYKEELWNF